MYEEFFGLKEKPFSILPDPSFLYWGRSHRLAYAMLEYGVLNHAGISVISGEVGCGKTTLVHRLLDQLSGSHSVALLSNIQAGRGDLLSWVLMGFGQPFAGKSHVELFAQLQEFFIGEYAKGRRVILIIDEAQNLSVDMLEELRMLSNINAGKDQLLQLILVGQPQLKDVLNRPDMLQLAQRIGSDFHLTPLSREEVEAYIETRLAIAGAQQRIFSEEAVDLIAEQSRGVPRVINIIADTALVYAYSAEHTSVDAETVSNVIRDKIEFGVFGIAAQSDPSAARSPSSEGPTAFVRKDAPASADEAHPAPLAQVAAPSAPLRPSAPARNADQPRMPLSRRQAQQAAPTIASSGQSALARTATAVDVAPAAAMDAPQPAASEEADAAPAGKLDAAALEQAAPASGPTDVGVVASGGGAAIEATVGSVGEGCRVIYVVQAEDESPAGAAAQAGAEVLMIADRALSPGRARNAGYRQLKKDQPNIRYVQFVESGFSLDPGWLQTAMRFMDRRPEIAVVEGRASDAAGRPVHNPAGGRRAGEIQIAGATSLVRAAAFEGAGGFRGDLIANEMTDLCVRLRRRGAHLWRLDAAMGVDARERPGGWWARGARRGFEYAHGVDLHGAPPEQLFIAEQNRAVVWGVIIPILIIVAAGCGAAFSSWLAPLLKPYLAASAAVGAGAVLYLTRIIVSASLYGAGKADSWRAALCETLAYFPEAFGVWRYHFGGARAKAAARSGG